MGQHEIWIRIINSYRSVASSTHRHLHDGLECGLTMMIAAEWTWRISYNPGPVIVVVLVELQCDGLGGAYRPFWFG